MQPLAINWVARPRHLTALGTLLALAGLLFAGAVALDYAGADAEQTALLARQSRLSKVGDASPKRTYVETAPLSRDATLSAAQIDAQLQLPWNDLLQAIESSRLPTVALLGIEAQGSARSLQLVGEGKNVEDVLAYVKKLRRAPTLRDVYLAGQEEVVVAGVTVVRFRLDATWGHTP